MNKNPKFGCKHTWRKLTTEDTDDISYLNCGWVCTKCNYLKNFVGKPEKVEEEMVNISVDLHKLDQEFMSELKERTGKADSEILKLALYELHNVLVKNKIAPFPTVPTFIPIPVGPSIPVKHPWDVDPINPWDPFPIQQPYIWYSTDTGDASGAKWVSWNSNTGFQNGCDIRYK